MLDNPLTRIGIAIIIGGLVAGFIIYLLPVYPLPAEFASGLGYFFGTLWQFDFVFPVAILLQLFSLIIVLEIIFSSVHLFIFLKDLFTKKH